MRRFTPTLIAALTISAIAAATLATLQAQARRGDWTTSGGDAQRTAWMRSDLRLTKQAVLDGELQFLWKARFENEARQLNSLTEPILQDLLIGYLGFKALAFVGGSADRLFAIDTDLARPYWTTHLTYAASTGGQPPSTEECPGGLIATPSRRTTLVPSAFGGPGGGGGGRSMSAVGEPGRGAAVLSEPRRRPAGGPPPRPAATGDPSAPARASRVAPVPFGGVDPLYAIGSDGLLRTLRVSDGALTSPPVPFLPPSARPSSLIFVDGMVYTTTSHGCGAAPNGVWAIDVTADNNVTTWSSGAANIAGRAGPAFGTDGSLYVATSRTALASAGASTSAGAPAAGAAPDPATARFANAVVALDRDTLEPKDWLTTDGADFNATPIVFRHSVGGKEREFVAAPGNNGRLYLLDAASLGGPDHRTPLHVTAPYTSAHTGGGLATWEDNGTRWIVASSAGDGAAQPGGLVAFKLVETAGRVTLEQAWRSRALVSPLPPLVVNGMVFAVSSGEYRGGPSTLTTAQRRQRSVPAVLYVLDAITGKQLWTSGTTITSFARAAMAAGSGQVYLVTHDNHLYAFGIAMEH